MAQVGPYTESLLSLTKATKEGKIYWEQQNPSTYYHESSLVSGEKFVTSVQRVGPLGLGSYVFQITNSETNEVVLDIKTVSDAVRLPALSINLYDYSEVIQSLYQEVELAINSRALNILNSIVDKFEPANNIQLPVKLTFVGARRVNPDRDGFDFQYLYHINDQTDLHQIHIVTNTDGAELAWYIEKAELVEYSKRAFVLAVKFIKWYWQTTGELPDEQRQYFEKKDLARLSDTSLEWQGYVLNLGGNEEITEL